ncbi:MAG: hypothetical protein ABIJ34_05985 [archaeon]
MDLDERLRDFWHRTLDFGIDFAAIEISIGLPIDTANIKVLNWGRPSFMAMHDIIHLIDGYLRNYSLLALTEIDPRMGFIGDLLAKLPGFKMSPDLFERTGYQMQLHMSGPPAYAPEVYISPVIIQSLLGLALYSVKDRIKSRFLRTIATAYSFMAMAAPYLDVSSKNDYKSSDIYHFAVNWFPHINYYGTLLMGAGLAAIPLLIIGGISLNKYIINKPTHQGTTMV